MKSLILKDILNIWHNVKSLGFIFAFLIITLIPQGGLESYIIFVCILCSTMIITTFNFDEHSCWVKYAMIMPISKKDYVMGKFATLLIFCGAGVGAAVVLGIAGGLIFKNFIALEPVTAVNLFSAAAAGLLISVVAGSTSILLLFRFGAARARILSLISIAVPFAIIFGIYKLMKMGGILPGGPLPLCCGRLLPQPFCGVTACTGPATGYSVKKSFFIRPPFIKQRHPAKRAYRLKAERPFCHASETPTGFFTPCPVIPLFIKKEISGILLFTPLKRCSKIKAKTYFNIRI